MGEVLKRDTGIKMDHVPFRGAAPLVTELLSGRIQFGGDQLSSSLERVRTGQLKALAVATKSVALPNVPTVRELGFANLELQGWNGFLAPKGTPEPVVARLQQEIAAAVKHPDVQKRMTDVGAEPSGSTQAEMRDMLQRAGFAGPAGGRGTEACRRIGARATRLLWRRCSELPMAAAFAFLGILLTSLLVARACGAVARRFLRGRQRIPAGDRGRRRLRDLCAHGLRRRLCARRTEPGRSTARRSCWRCWRWRSSQFPAWFPGSHRIPAIPTWGSTRSSPSRWSLLVPSVLAVLVQWALVRRRHLQMAGEDDLTLWPWVTTVVAAFVILNPYGLAFLQAALKRTAGDTMWQFAMSVTVGAACGLIVMAAIECYIRRRLMRRRKARPRCAQTCLLIDLHARALPMRYGRSDALRGIPDGMPQ